MILVSISMFAGPWISNIVSLSTLHVLVPFFYKITILGLK